MRVGPAFAQTFASQVVQSAASIATGIVIARGLGPVGQGRYAFFAAIVAFGVIVASLGQFEGNVLSSAGASSLGRLLLSRTVAHALLVAALLLALLPLWRQGFQADAATAIPVFFAIVLALEVEAQLLRGVNLGQHHITAYNVATLLQRFVYLTAVASFAVTIGLRLERVLAAWAGATFLSVLVSGVWIWVRSAPVALDWRRLLAGWGAMLTRGLRALVTIALTLLLVRCDIWMLRPLLGVATVGQMSVATGLAEWLWYVPSILGNVLFAAAAADRGPRTVQQITRAARAVVALVVPAAIVLMLFGRRLVPLVYGAAYQPAGLLFVILLPGMTAVAVHLVVDSYFAGKGFPRISIWAAAGALALKVGLNLVAIPAFGAPGAAAVTTGVYTALLLVKVVAFTRETGTPIAAVLRPSWRELAGNAAAARAWVAAQLGTRTS